MISDKGTHSRVQQRDTTTTTTLSSTRSYPTCIKYYNLQVNLNWNLQKLNFENRKKSYEKFESALNFVNSEGGDYFLKGDNMCCG